MKRRGIPTAYGGVNFRSRLEAKWAAFFDLCGWQWTYEPFDLYGYIPDFVLDFHRPLLVEVKGVATFGELERHTGKIDSSGWEHEVLLVGGCIGREGDAPGSGDITQVGLLRERFDDDEGTMHYGWNDACIGSCEDMPAPCARISVCSSIGGFECRVCGNYDGKALHGLRPGLVDALWREAGNLVQWRP